MYFFAAVAALSALTTPALQSQTQIQPRIGYYSGNSFASGASTKKLNGVELGIDLPVTPGSFGATGLRFSPSIVLGGVLSHGGDADGQIYRFLFTQRSPMGQSGAFIGGGFGYGMVQPRGSQFGSKNGIIGEFAVGYRPQALGAIGMQPYVEAAYQEGPDNRLRGISFRVGARF